MNAHFTDREKEVITYVALGLSNKVIAQRIGLSERRVEVIRHHIRSKDQKCGKNVQSMTAYAVACGFVPREIFIPA